MKILDDWQYKYIERCLYDYHSKTSISNTPTEQKMTLAIQQALEFFKGTPHEIMITEFYFNSAKYRNKFTNAGHYRYVCQELLHTEEPNGYVIRREIVYRIAMNCYSMNLFNMIHEIDRR